MRRFIPSDTSIAPLVVFRVLFGFIMAISILRFALNGWIHSLYVAPRYYFTFYGFDWAAPLGEFGMYALFLLMGLAALGIMVGLHYRIAAVLFFLTFSYVELIDKANYLNHYYFVSIVSFLLIWLPANRSLSVDVKRNPRLRVDTVPAWTINILRLQLGLVYVFAGLAKLNAYWLFEAMPLRLWLPAHAHLPVVGGLLEEPLTAYVFSWAAALYDLTIVFFLLWRKTSAAAYGAVLVFHLATALLFPIGMFPYIMILCTLIFFPASVHERLITAGRSIWSAIFGREADLSKDGNATPAIFSHRTSHQVEATPSRMPYRFSKRASASLAALLMLHFIAQVLIPLRSTLYPGHLFWTEEGYRFSWRVMLMEKAGYVAFRIHDPATSRNWEEQNWRYLTPNQEKMMSTQPDMILQFAHFLQEEYRRLGMQDVEITARAYVTLNGRKSRPMVDPKVDLTKVERGLAHKTWILPYSGTEENWISRR